MPSTFLIKDAKFLLLTYSRVPDHLVDSMPMSIVHRSADRGAECLVGQEQHADGGTHFHAFIDFGGERYSTRNQHDWDIEGIHPNIEKGGRTPWLIYDYVCKDGNIVGGGAERPEETTSSKGADKWELVLNAATRTEFLLRLREHYPRVLVASFGSVSKYADWAYAPDPVEYLHPENYGFTLEGYPGLLDWVDDNMRGGVEGR